MAFLTKQMRPFRALAQVLLKTRSSFDPISQGAPVNLETQLIPCGFNPVLCICMGHGLRTKAINSQDDISRTQVGSCRLASRSDLKDVSRHHLKSRSSSLLSFILNLCVSSGKLFSVLGVVIL